MSRKGTWNLQQVRDKYLQQLWINEAEVWTTGKNDYGELGNLTRTPSIQKSSPVQIFGDNINWTDIQTNNMGQVAGLKSDNTLWIWGRGTKGQLMHTGQNGPDGHRSSPIQVGSYTNITDFCIGNETIMWINTSGELWAAGNNNVGELAQNNRTDRSSPVQIPGTTWRSIEGGSEWCMGIKTDNTLWVWGAGSYGALGLNSHIYAGTYRYSSPVQIPGTTWNKATGGYHMSWLTKTDGTLWSMGFNIQGQLGQNDTINKSSPVQVPGDWSNCVLKKSNINGYNFLAVKSDGTMWTCGRNQNGQLGLGSKTNYSSPVQIPGTYITSKRPSQGGSNGDSSAAIKSDYTAVAWGINEYGQFGTNSTTPTSDGIDPSQLGETPGVKWVDVAMHDAGFGGIRNTLNSSQE